MIFQYCLSLYGVKFTVIPHFRSFKIRIINQQNGDCFDCSNLNTEQLDGDSHPIIIKFKAGQKVKLKLKMLSTQKSPIQKVLCESQLTFDNTSIDSSKKIIFTDKKNHSQPFCIIQLFISGIEIQKSMNARANKLDTIPDISSGQQNQSITVQSDQNYYISQISFGKDTTETPEVTKTTQQSQKTSQLRPTPVTFHHKKPYVNSNFLNNTAYLSSSSKNIDRGIHPQTTKLPSIAASQHDSLPQILEQNGSEGSINELQQKYELKMQHIRPPLSKNQLNNHSLNENRKLNNRKNKSKRNQSLAIEINSFVRYFQSYESSKYIRNIHALKSTQDHLGNKGEETIQIPIETLIFSRFNQEILFEFDAAGFLSYCTVNQIEEPSIDIKIPDQLQGFRANLKLEQELQLEGTLGIQQGDAMLIKLIPKELLLASQSVLKNEVYRLKFDISSHRCAPLRRRLLTRESCASPLQDEIDSNESIKLRIKSRSLQPWAYGQTVQSNANSKESSLTLLERLNKSTHVSISSSISKNSDSKKLNPDPQFTQKHHRKLVPLKNKNPKSKKKTFVTQYQDIETNDEKDQVSKLSKLNTTKVSLKGNKHEINEINRIRNGNRNNIRFKEKKELNTKAPKIKEMWEKLLIKKKIEEEQQTHDNSHRLRKAKKVMTSASDISENNTLERRENQNKSLLYSYSPRQQKLIKVKEPQQNHIEPIPSGSTERRVTLEVNNISITETTTEVVVQGTGKFVKLSVESKATYYTEIIFSEECNSILWKLSGCIFRNLTLAQRLQIEIYETIDNKIQKIGGMLIRLSKLNFIRNNHVFNGQIINKQKLYGQFMLGFQITEVYPFEVIRQEDQVDFSYNTSTKQYSKPQNRNLNRTNQHQYDSISHQDLLEKKRRNKTDMNITLRRHNRLQHIKDQQSQDKHMPLGLKS